MATAKKMPARARPAGEVATKLPEAMTGRASLTKAAVGDKPVFAYIASLPQPQRGIAERVDSLAEQTLPGLQRSVKWGMSYYGVGDGWCFCCGGFSGHVKLMFINGTNLLPVPPVTPVAMGKATRGVELESADDLDPRQIAEWMRQVAAVPGVGTTRKKVVRKTPIKRTLVEPTPGDSATFAEIPKGSSRMSSTSASHSARTNARPRRRRLSRVRATKATCKNNRWSTFQESRMGILDKMVAAVVPEASDEDRAEARAKARSLSRGGGWLGMVLDHHEAIEAAFARVKAAGSANTRRAAQKQLAALLTGHSIAEEAVLYPAMALTDQKGHSSEAYTEQSAAKVQTAALDDLEPMSQDYLDKLEHLRAAVAHHVYEEEHEWFPKLREMHDAQKQTRWTKRYKEEYDRYIGQA